MADGTMWRGMWHEEGGVVVVGKRWRAMWRGSGQAEINTPFHYIMY